jgi:hypothetical protein
MVGKGNEFPSDSTFSVYIKNKLNFVPVIIEHLGEYTWMTIKEVFVEYWIVVC